MVKKKKAFARGESLSELSFWIGRVFYNYVGLLERMLADVRLEQYVAPGMGQVLFALFERDDCIIKEIGERVGLSPSTMSGMLERMEGAGLITRRRDSADARAVRIRLTRLGRSLEPKCRLLAARIERVLRRGMTNAEAETLKRLLAQMIENIRKSAEEDLGVERRGRRQARRPQAFVRP